ncbi:DNA polymerase IV [Ginsengibacter hankyongi]|uniref:DNA polymerase IV n=1 Tax=Ginsengibacter hankyongi TaxID=2607284 RepID=A0A5J5IHL4_9BACT|nr:DNA polymerase IV [Ginsengibacter hankyongi]KAA9039153.1 DNA polymerase IV [Ginsengibacter hankyongi]
MQVSSSNLIAHFDLDSFFVSVEFIRDPSLKGKAVIVGGSKERGIVTTCSYEARKFGVHSAMPMATAMRLCPQAIVVKGTYSEYSRYSKWVTQIIASKAPLFEKASIDEFYIDLTGMDKFFNPLQWTIDLRELITNETGLPISFGIARNKMIAKMATNEAKPNGFLQVPLGKEKEFLSALELNKIPGVGEQTNQVLQNNSFKYIRDIHNSTPEKLEKILGKWGVDLWNRVQGTHHSTISPYHESKSISTENTFEENITDVNKLMSEIVRMSEKIAFELRKDEKVAGCVTVKLRYPDFETTSRQTSIAYTNADDEIIPIAKNLFHKLYKKGQPVRLLGVRLSDLTNDAVQANLFENIERKNILYKAIDDVKNRFGSNSVNRASGKSDRGKNNIV